MTTFILIFFFLKSSLSKTGGGKVGMCETGVTGFLFFLISPPIFSGKACFMNSNGLKQPHVDTVKKI